MPNENEIRPEQNPLKGHFQRGELDGLARGHGTDKSSAGHDYMRFYEAFLRPYKHEAFVLLELGVGPTTNKGKSLFTWRDFFPRAHIVGVDMRSDAKDVEGERVSVEIGNCGKAEFLRELGNRYKPFVILDDASHRWSHQILALETLFPLLLSGGIYILEDLQTSFGPHREESYADQPVDAFAYLARLAHLVVGGTRRHPGIGEEPPPPALARLARQIDAITVCKGTAVLMKRQ